MISCERLKVKAAQIKSNPSKRKNTLAQIKLWRKYNEI